MAKATVWYKTRLCFLPKYKDPIPAHGKTTESCWKNICCCFLLFAQTKQPLVIFSFQLSPPQKKPQLLPDSIKIQLQHASYIGIFNPNRWRLVINAWKYSFPVEVRPAAPQAQVAQPVSMAVPPPCPIGLHSPWSNGLLHVPEGSTELACSWHPGWALLNNNHNTFEGTASYAHSAAACAPD